MLDYVVPPYFCYVFHGKDAEVLQITHDIPSVLRLLSLIKSSGSFIYGAESFEKCWTKFERERERERACCFTCTLIKERWEIKERSR